MCDDCGCGDTELVPIEVQQRILAGNDAMAAHNRLHFRSNETLVINLMGSPGSGKTAVLEATARDAAGRWRMAAVSGDLATDHDAKRLAAAGLPSRTITTGTACHLDARMVHDVIHGAPWGDLDVFFVENVGNLVCPAIYDLGQAANVVALSVTEGEDKPIKYPVMFKAADLVLLTKVDLLPHLDVDVAAIEAALARVMPAPRMIRVSARTGEGIHDWIAWLEAQRAQLHAREHRHHHHHHPHGHGHGHVHVHEHGAHDHEH